MAREPASSEDTVFRYPLAPQAGKGTAHPARITELIRAQLRDLLDLVIPVSGTKELKVDGFRLLRDRDRTVPVFDGDAGERLPDKADTATCPTATGFQDARNASLYEPRVAFIKAQLESLLSVVEMEKDGKPVQVDGFRLKDLRDWLVPSAGDPIEVFGYAGARCDADCVFCYNRGNPPCLALKAPTRSAAEETEEMQTRLTYFSPEAGLALFPSLGSTYEVLAHPGIFSVLRQLRKKTEAVFRIATHGGLLTRERIRRLSRLQPVYLYLSLISASPARRRRLVRDRNPQTAIRALPLLRDAGIPYATVIVPWPVDSVAEMLADLAGTVAYADEHDSHLIQVNLPGYSRYFSEDKLYDRDEVWSAVVATVRELREETTAPIVVMPAVFEENTCEERRNRPVIVGLVKNSPAARAGLGRGDEILEVGGLAVQSRPQARALLAALHEARTQPTGVVVRRGGQRLDLTMDPRDSSYPYSESVDRHLGIVMMGTGFRPSYVEKLREMVDCYQAKRVLFLSSELVRPSFEQALAESPLFASGRPEIDIQVPRNRFFGGDICMGDLLVVQDFIDCIREHLANGGKRPDLIVIPSSPFNLGAWKRDLTGRVYLEIEREVGIPVELLECATVYE